MENTTIVSTRLLHAAPRTQICYHHDPSSKKFYALLKQSAISDSPSFLMWRAILYQYTPEDLSKTLQGQSIWLIFNAVLVSEVPLLCVNRYPKHQCGHAGKYSMALLNLLNLNVV
ncbi:hypothetical protein AMECASPLE_036842 [Ameca splendens]|uniref:Uncharacterized protein n=1 Tax=Ameca splendens TaxID=208324 RepID=A0ABV0ZUU8_9TELE